MYIKKYLYIIYMYNNIISLNAMSSNFKIDNEKLPMIGNKTKRKLIYKTNPKYSFSHQQAVNNIFFVKNRINYDTNFKIDCKEEMKDFYIKKAIKYSTLFLIIYNEKKYLYNQSSLLEILNNKENNEFEKEFIKYLKENNYNEKRVFYIDGKEYIIKEPNLFDISIFLNKFIYFNCNNNININSNDNSNITIYELSEYRMSTQGARIHDILDTNFGVSDYDSLINKLFNNQLENININLKNYPIDYLNRFFLDDEMNKIFFPFEYFTNIFKIIN